MIVQATFHIHPENKEKVKAEMRKLKTVIQKHGGRNFRHFASMTSGTPNRMFTYEVDTFAHFDALNADPDYRAVKLDSFYSDATLTLWGDVDV
jgi:hypothetical protein